MEKNCELNYSPKELSRNTVSRLFKELINNILTSCIYSCIWLKVRKCIWYFHLINWLLILLSENLRGWQPHFISTQERIGTNHISVINKLHRFNRYLDQSTTAWNEGYPNVPEDFTITEKAPTRASWLLALSHLRHY